jgi:tetratricopeptide (TPR) repeat protein
MIKGIAARICAGLLVLGVSLGAAEAQGTPQKTRVAAPSSNVRVDGSEAMFTTMCALYAAGYEGEVNEDNWSTFRTRIRERVRQQQGPAVEALREFYKLHQLRDPGAMLSRYVWFGLVAGTAPKFEPVLKREELPPDMLALEGFSEILSNYYTEQNIGEMWKQVQPEYDREIERLHDPVSQVVLVSTSYLREILDPSKPGTFTIIVEPLVGRITNVRNYGDDYAVVLSGSEEIPVDVVRHAFLHFLLDPLPLMYPHVVVLKRPVFEIAAKAPRLAPDLKDDFFSWFSECLVRAAELKVKRMSPGEREGALTANDTSGYVLVRPIFQALTGFEKSEPSIRIYFPDLVRGIDEKAEEQRVAGIKFAPAETQAEAAALSGEEVARKRRARVTTIPDDQEALAQLTEGERRIAERNARAAESAFKSVLAKYPDQPRAWYGLALVALMLDQNVPQAKDIFGRLTSGEHAATQDPMVLAWSHVYLGQIYEDEGQLEKSKTEYQAALAVQGAPSKAQQAAQKGLGELDLRKPGERP